MLRTKKPACHLVKLQSQLANTMAFGGLFQLIQPSYLHSQACELKKHIQLAVNWG